MIFSVKFGSILHRTHSNVNADTGFSILRRAIFISFHMSAKP